MLARFVRLSRRAQPRDSVCKRAELFDPRAIQLERGRAFKFDLEMRRRVQPNAPLSLGFIPGEEKTLLPEKLVRDYRSEGHQEAVVELKFLIWSVM